MLQVGKNIRYVVLEVGFLETIKFQAGKIIFYLCEL